MSLILYIPAIFSTVYDHWAPILGYRQLLLCYIARSHQLRIPYRSLYRRIVTIVLYDYQRWFDSELQATPKA